MYFSLLLRTALSAYILVSSAAAQVPVDQFYTFGPSVDTLLPSADDASSPRVSLWTTFKFANYTETQLWVNTNGDITFAQAFASWLPDCKPMGAAQRMIAPFLAHMHRTGFGRGGNGYYRQTTDRSLLHKANADILQRYPDFVGISVNWLFIATWHECTPRTGDSKYATFQVVLATDGVFSFAIFYYNKIDFSSGDDDGKTFAKAGFDVGDGTNFFMIEESCTNNIISIAKRSNMAQPGKYVFRVDSADIDVANCEKSSYERGKQLVNVKPTYVSEMGNVLLSLNGPCFPASSNVTCRFTDAFRGVIDVVGVLQTSAYAAPTVHCLVPHLPTMGRTMVELFVQSGVHLSKYSGQLIVASLPYEFDVNIASFDTSGLIEIYWNPQLTLLKDAPSVSIDLLWYNSEAKDYQLLQRLATEVANSGSAKLNHNKVMPSVADISKVTNSFLVFSIRPKANEQSDSSFRPLIEQGRVFSRKIFTVELFRETVYNAVCPRLQRIAPHTLPPCPCTTTLAEIDGAFFVDQQDAATLRYFHSGAAVSFRQSTPNEDGSGQQCVYNANGRLLSGPPHGGTADRYSPSGYVNSTLHVFYDVLPWYACCKIGNKATCLRRYYEARPSDDCGKYVAPRPAQSSGDPHFATFDGLRYTFNGAGEFVLIEDASANGRFVVQARAEPLAGTNTTVFTAFAMRHRDTVVQVQASSLATGTLDLLVNQRLVPFEPDAALLTQSFNNDVSLCWLSTNKSLVRVALPCGLSFTISIFRDSKALALLSAAAQTLSGGDKVHGLLGNYDGEAENDLSTPNGTLVPTNASLSEIHSNFGLLWAVTENSSVFAYSRGKSFASYAKPDFKPNFDLADFSALPQEAKDLCGASTECLFDYQATGGDLSFAQMTVQTYMQYNRTLQVVLTGVLKCGTVQSPRNGYYYAEEAALAGTVVTFGCDQGYSLVGAANITCLGDKASEMRWSSYSPTCSGSSALWFSSVLIVAAFSLAWCGAKAISIRI